MRGLSRGAGLLLVASLTVVLAACSGGDEGGSAAPSPTFTVAPTGEGLVVEPLEAVAGATRTDVSGVGIDVPAGLERSVQTVDESTQILQLTAPGADRAAVLLTVTTTEGATDDDVDATSLVTERQLGASGIAADLARTPATFSGWAHAVALTATLSDVGADGDHEVLVVTARDEAGDRLVSVTAEAPVGELDVSVALEALRTVRADG